MTILRDGFLAFCSAVGLTTLVWLLAGPLLRVSRPSVPGLRLVLPVTGEAPALEADMRELRRLQGQISGAQIVLVDCGLTEEARDLAEYLAERETNALVIDAQIFRVS